MENKGTYDRKYYLHRRVKRDGFALQLEHCHKTILVEQSRIEEARENNYVRELQSIYSYGIQLLNPLTHETKIH